MKKNDDFIKVLEEIREHDESQGITILETAYKILQALAIYGNPNASIDDIKTNRADALAGLCDIAAACSSCHVLARTQDYLITECARERRKNERRQASDTLMFTFIKKWAGDLETSGKAKSRAEALIMAAEAYHDLSERAHG